MSCIACMIALYLLFLPPFIVSGRPRCYRRLHRCRVRLRRRRPYPYRRTSRQAEPLPLSHISPTVLYFICCTRHMLLLCYNPIQLHSLSLSPLDYFPISYAAYTYVIYTAVDPALC